MNEEFGRLAKENVSVDLSLALFPAISESIQAIEFVEA